MDRSKGITSTKAPRLYVAPPPGKTARALAWTMACRSDEPCQRTGSTHGPWASQARRAGLYVGRSPWATCSWSSRARTGAGAAGSNPSSRRRHGRTNTSKQTRLLTGFPGNPKT